MSDSEVPEIPAQTVPALPPLAPPRFFARLARRPFTLLALLGLLLWLPGILSLPALDRDESRFAQSSRQMVESGDPIDIRLGHVPRYKKPVGIYWLQALGTDVAGQILYQGGDSHIWTYRLPSLLGAIAASWLTAWCALAFLEGEAALVAGLLILGSVLLAGEATLATTDAVLLACVVAVQGVLLRVYRAARDPEAPQPSMRLVMLGWAAVGAGALVKFPVVPGVALVTVMALVAWDRQWRWLGRLMPLRGLLLALVIASPWLIAITIQSHGAFLRESVGHDLADKIAGGQESHGGLPGYYLALSAVSFFPAILFVLPGLGMGVARRAEPAMRFLLAWAGGWWLVVEAVPTKLPHYVIDAYPALAILAALFVTSAPPAMRLLSGWLTAARWIGGVQFVIGAGLLTAALVLLPSYFGVGPVYGLYGAAGVAALLALAALGFSVRRAYVWSVLLSLLAMLVFVPALTAGAGPRLTQLWVTERLKPLVAAATQPGDPPPALAGYQEPSMLFALGKDVLLTNGAGAAEAGARSGGLALVEDGEQGAFLARLAELQADASVVGEIGGFNYSRGRKVHVTLYRVAQLRELH
jgi:4-amino-4-deoxy-L-arabinose transferase-like glycosyltransferase